MNFQKKKFKKENKKECKHCGYPHNNFNLKFKKLSCNQCGKSIQLQRVCRAKKENLNNKCDKQNQFKKS